MADIIPETRLNERMAMFGITVSQAWLSDRDR